MRPALPPERGSRALFFLYGTVPGRALLRPLISRPVSRLVGRLLDSRVSRVLVRPFARKNAIDPRQCVKRTFDSFNDFFTRELRPELRPVCADPEALIAPCDGLLSAYRLRGDTVLPVKQSAYTVPELLGGDRAAERFADGLCLVFRLRVEHYHRYCYPDDGVKGPNVFIPGELHTVRPVALARMPVFARNCREYTLLKTERFGTVAQVEVGALLVGRIANRHGPGPVRRGEEKGMFLYGGSTVVLLLEKDAVRVPEEVFAATERGEEIPVRRGEAVGRVFR